MPTMKEKVSAFSVFKARKTTSLTNVLESEATPSTTTRKVSHSANTTPTNTKQKALTAILNKITHSEHKKHKSEVRKAKKLLKNAAKGERLLKGKSGMLESPLVSLDMPSGEGRVRNKSTSSSQYSLPLKATPEVTGVKLPVSESVKTRGKTPEMPVNGKTPPLPPRRPVRSSSQQQIQAKTGKKRTSSGSSRRSEVTPPVSKAANRVPSTEPAPPQPSKRQRLSGETESAGSRQSLYPSPTKSLVLSLPGTSLPYMYDSQQEARKLFECLIHPVKTHKFFTELWEKKPLLVKRHMDNYNDGWFSTAELDKILRENHLVFSKNVDVTSYIDGKRQTHNPPGRAYAPVVWDYYQNGCSVRVLNPQTYSHNVWKLLSILQEYFNCFVGANVYLTPPGTQGFAPHYDDIEAFILQLEGRKHWKLYSPRTENETLPRHSSGNFTDQDIGEPILDVILEAGDLLYFPRGTIHQGKTEDTHSLHITVSCMQKNTWGDLFEHLAPRAVQVAIDEDMDFRKSLPRDYLNYMGVAFSDKDCVERQQFLKTVERLMSKLTTYVPVDAACDQMAKRFVHDSLPPVFTESEKQCSIHGNGEQWHAEEQRIVGAVELEPDTQVKLIRKGVVRLVSEEDQVLIYHNLENSRVYHECEVQCLEISAEFAPAVEHLLHSYPDFVKIDDLPLESVEERMELASILYEKGALLSSKALVPVSDEETSLDTADEEQENRS